MGGFMSREEQEALLLQIFHEMSEEDQAAMLRTTQYIAAKVGDRPNGPEDIVQLFELFRQAH
jgi:hypothetical protein